MRTQASSLPFLLLNDAEVARHASPESWKLVIDGKELEDSWYLFGNGPMPSGGYEVLAAGATFSFGKALPVSKYFPERREYKISWKGKDFQSPTMLFKVTEEKKMIGVVPLRDSNSS